MGHESGIKKEGRAGDLVHIVWSAVRDRLLSGTLAPGNRIREAEIARELGISRAPVREALRMMEQKGLVAKSPNLSYVVVTLTERDISELMTMRVALEGLAAKLSFRRARTIEAMTAALSDMRKAVKRNDYVAAMASDKAFHLAMIEGADHDRLREVYATLTDQMHLAYVGLSLRRPDLTRIVKDHELLFDLAVNGASEDLVEELTRHIQFASTVLRNTV
ncbi:hypothetical protein CVO77_14610 [Sphingopyxis lindanitolerans]|uniref:HTH gntR-type domain-containing protein n=1 Tax=Sphingopyxis lindanitolerans TaxID=2054227 RepID=A0A2S8B202_9SPHN|nr:GntR family transcriptional regulator [Sphingopyxis lindanitolerans]PQM26289.1 hypothetical protein CVO77_14610 [Sphingopyxis lindanitolerans]